MSSSMHYIKCMNEACGLKTPVSNDMVELAARWNARFKTQEEIRAEEFEKFMANQKNAQELNERVKQLQQRMDSDVIRIGLLVQKNPFFFNANPGDSTLKAAADKLEEIIENASWPSDEPIKSSAVVTTTGVNNGG